MAKWSVLLSSMWRSHGHLQPPRCKSWMVTEICFTLLAPLWALACNRLMQSLGLGLSWGHHTMLPS